MELQRNKGYVEKKQNGYFGTINIDNIQFDIVCTFWSRPSMIWLKRVKAKKYDHVNNTFEEYEPRPYFDCKAKRVVKDSSYYYEGSFSMIWLKRVKDTKVHQQSHSTSDKVRNSLPK